MRLPTLGNIQPISIRAQAVDRLREAILHGELKPGQRIVERQLAQAMGISQVSVREVLQQLEQEGLVTKKPNTATFVTELTARSFEEILEVRLQLEPLAMRLASQKLTREDEGTLQFLVDEINQKIEQKDQYYVSRADFRFHQAIWQMGGNQTLAKTLTQLCNPYYSYVIILSALKDEEVGLHFGSDHVSQIVTQYFKQNLRVRVQPHQRLLDVLKRGNEQAMTDAIREHILGTWGALLHRSKTRRSQGNG